MIPTGIMISLYIFIAMYFIGLGLSIYMLIKAFKDKERSMMLLSLIFIILFVLFGLGLI